MGSHTSPHQKTVLFRSPGSALRWLCSYKDGRSRRKNAAIDELWHLISETGGSQEYITSWWKNLPEDIRIKLEPLWHTLQQTFDACLGCRHYARHQFDWFEDEVREASGNTLFDVFAGRMLYRYHREYFTRESERQPAFSVTDEKTDTQYFNTGSDLKIRKERPSLLESNEPLPDLEEHGSLEGLFEFIPALPKLRAEPEPEEDEDYTDDVVESEDDIDWEQAETEERLSTAFTYLNTYEDNDN